MLKLLLEVHLDMVLQFMQQQTELVLYLGLENLEYYPQESVLAMAYEMSHVEP